MCGAFFICLYWAKAPVIDLQIPRAKARGN